MSNGRNGFVHSTSEGGVAASHPIQPPRLVKVGPATAGEHNTLKTAIFPIACWRVDDIRFAFDASFVKPDIVDEMGLLSALVRAHPGAPASVFGHADPVGNDDYNKQLSGRRAAVIYGLLTRNTEIWEDIYSQAGEFTSALSSDDWGLKAMQTMLEALGYAPGPIDGIMGNQTREAVRRFQRDQEGLADDGNPGPQTRAKLFLAYMDTLCRDEAGQPFTLAPADFLAQGTDSEGKGDYQGCSEFNPVLMFSQAENERFRQAPDRTERNAANAPNRRVDVFLFRPGSRVSAERWPCPRAKEGIAGCQKRFFADAERRRTFQVERREQERTKDTFACRFYDRIAGGSPCERSVALAEKGIFYLDLFDDLKLPDDAMLIVEGLLAPFRVAVRDAFDSQRGVYAFVLQDVVPGARCRARLEASQGSFILFEDVDLYTFVERVLQSDSEPPIPVHLPEEFVDHVLAIEEEEVDDPVPEGEEGDWEFPDEQQGDEPSAQNDTEVVEALDFEFDPEGEN